VTGAAPRLVVLRALGLGDLLTAVPALRALAAAFPGHRRLLVGPAALAPLVALVDAADGAPAIDEVLDAGPLEPVPAAGRGADVAVNLHGRGPQSHAVLLAASPGSLVAFAHPDVPASQGGPQWRPDEHERDRWCRMLAAHDIPADPADLELRAPAVPAPEQARDATVLHPGAAQAARRWPVDRWIEVARARARAGDRVVLTGSPAEAGTARAVAEGAGLPASCVLAGTTGPAELAAVVAAARVVVCGDTGVGHLATALGVPSVLLFGPSPPSTWGPPPERTRHRVLWAGRTGDPRGDRPDPGLLAITADEVLRALEAPAVQCNLGREARIARA
jgi:ADP-heptose:LPS heptosyltransferase